MTVIAYAVSDTHIPAEADAGAWKDLPGVSGDALFALGQVVALCVRDHVPLLAAGDLVDDPDVEPAALAAWFSVMRPLQDAGLPVLAILGNHDRSRDWLAAFGPTAVRLDGRTVTLPSGHTVSGLSWVPNDRFAEAVAGISRYTDIGLYHQPLADLTGRGVNASQLPPHRLAVVGDTHVATTLTPPAGPKLVLSPGPLAPQSVAEFGPPGVWAVHDDLSVSRVSLPHRAWHSFLIDSPAAADACVAACGALAPDPALPDLVARPLVAVRLTADVDGFVPTVRELARSRDFALRVLDAGPGRVDHPSPAPAPPRGADLAEALRLRLPADPGALELALELAAPGADPLSVLAAARARDAAEAAPAVYESEDESHAYEEAS